MRAADRFPVRLRGVRAAAGQHPEWKTKQAFKSFLENDRSAFAAAGEKGIVQIVTAAHAGMTMDSQTASSNRRPRSAY